jgi:hypothetical protein
MDRKIITGITLGVLFAGFGLFSFLVILTKRHPYFVEKKLRLGALILSLSGAAIGCTATTCYSPIMTNMVVIDNSITSNDTIVISKSVNDTISGKITERVGTTFSYAILDSSTRIVAKDNLHPTDGAFDENVEEFAINIASTPRGKYNIQFYEVQADSIDSQYRIHSFTLEVKD